MTEEEFALSLPQDISDNERTRRLEEWRKQNPQPEVEEEVEKVVEEKPIGTQVLDEVVIGGESKETKIASTEVDMLETPDPFTYNELEEVSTEADRLINKATSYAVKDFPNKRKIIRALKRNDTEFINNLKNTINQGIDLSVRSADVYNDLFIASVDESGNEIKDLKNATLKLYEYNEDELSAIEKAGFKLDEDFEAENKTEDLKRKIDILQLTAKSDNLNKQEKNSLNKKINELERIVPDYDKKRKQIHDAQDPGFFSKDTVYRTVNTVSTITSGLLKGDSFANKIAARAFYPDQLAEIEKIYAGDASAEAKAINDLIANSKLGTIDNMFKALALPGYAPIKLAFEKLSGKEVGDYAIDIANNIDSYADELDEKIFKYEMGVSESISTALSDGDFAGLGRSLSRTTKEAVASLPYMAVSSMGIPGLAVIGISTAAGGEFEENNDASDAYKELINLSVTDPNYVEKKKQLEDRIKAGEISIKNLTHHTVVGAANSILERFSGRLGNKLYNSLRGQSKKAVEKTLKDYAVDLLSDSGGEGLTESMQTAIEKASNALIQGKEVEWSQAWEEIVDAGIIGSVSGFGVSGTATTTTLASKAIDTKKQNNILKKSNVNSSYELFDEDTGRKGREEEDFTTEGQMQFTQISGAKKRLDQELESKTKSGEITVEKSNSIKEKFIQTQQAVNLLKPIGIENNSEAVNLMLKQNELKKKIKELESVSPEAAIESKKELEANNKRLAEIVSKSDKKVELDKGAAAIAAELEVPIFTGNQTEVDSKLKELREKGGKVDEKSSTNYGTIITMKDGSQEIVINNEIAAEDRIITTSQHEVLHAVLARVDESAKQKFGKDLLNELINNPDIQVGDSIISALESYENDPTYTPAMVMEEVMALTSEGLTSGEIKIKENALTKIGDFIRRALQSYGISVSFKNGKDVLNFIKDYNRDIKKGKGRSKGVKNVVKAMEKGKTVFTPKASKPASVVTPLAKELIKEDNALLQQALISEIKTGGETRFDTAQAITEKNWGLISPLLNINSQQEMNAAKEVVIDQLMGTFEGSGQGKYSARNTSALEGFSLDPDAGAAPAQVSTYLVKTIRTRKPEIDAAIADRTGRSGQELQQAGSEVVTETETIDTTKLAKKPSETTGLEPETETRITEAVQKVYKGKDVKFSETRNIPKEVADIYGEEFGINPQTITDKTRNFQKTDADGLTKAKQFLLKNAKDDFARLPKTKDDFGKGTFIPKNVRDALYTDGELTGSLKDYMDLIRTKPEKPVYRDRVGQTIRGLLGLHIRNRMLETAQPSQAKRVQSGAKFSKRRKPNAAKFEEVSRARTKNDTNNIVGTKTEVNDSNRKKIQDQVQDSIEKYGLNENTFDAARFNNSGAQRTRMPNGDVVYKLTNGKTIPGVPNGKNKNGVKQFKQPTLIQIEKIHGEDVTLVAARNRLYYGVSDPAYIKAKDAAKNNNKVNQPKFKRVTVKNAFTDKGRKQARINQDILENTSLQLEKAVSNGMPLSIAGIIIEGAYQATTGLIKVAAPFKYKSNKFEYAEQGKASDKQGNKYREEHTPPASVIGGSLLLAIKNGTVKQIIPLIKDNYMQVQLSKKDDSKIDKANLDSMLPEEISILTPNSGVIRFAAADIDLNSITNPITGKTMAQEIGIPISDKNNINLESIHYQNELIIKSKSEITSLDKQKLKSSLPVQNLKSTQAVENSDNFSDVISSDQRSEQQKDVMIKSLETKINASRLDSKRRGISVFDFDDTLARTKEKVIVNMPDGSIDEISASEFAKTAGDLQSQGAEFDFVNFENVAKETKEGPLADLARKRQDKFGSGDIFILTARPNSAGPAIQQFLKSIGINIPLKNITGLEDGSSQAKADWVLNKTAEGYNDFYFADDSFANVAGVKAVLDAVDVKNKVQQAKASKRRNLDKDFNRQLEQVTGKEAFKKYSDARGRLEGQQKDKGAFKRFIKQFTITPSAEDFMGLMYAFMGKGAQGNAHAKFIKENLMDPYNKAEQELISAQVSVANDFAELKKQFPNLRSKRGKNPLLEEIGVGPYTKSQAIRVYMWNKQGMDIPGMSQRDINALVKAVEADNELNVFADEVALIQKGEQYPAPTQNWLAGNIASDIMQGLKTGFRKKLMTEFNENADIIFSKENLNKIEAIYGSKFREALEDSLRRMKTGSNRPVFVGGGARIVNEMLDWLNASVGAVMFFNMRSGLLQLISNVNFINWGDNNIYDAAKAFVSKDYFPTVLKLLNSDYLINRRDGLKINVNEAELTDAGRKGGVKGMINYLLDKGFAITRIMDSVAIATGGATFFINRKKSLQNRVNKETGELYTEAEAEQQAFDDFYAIAEETQQSSNPSKISAQQASFAGRIILSFQNVTMQYNRKTKKSIQDLYNRRTKPGMTQRESDLSNLSSIIYYVGVQNLIFNAMQQALFGLAFDDEPDEEEKDKAANIVNGMADSLLFGLGFGGAIISTVKNVLMRIASESEKKTTQYRDAVWNVFDISPVLDSKVRKLRTAAKTFDWNMKEIKKRGWSIENPAYLAVAQIISATTNLPIDRALQKLNNLRQATDEETKTWQRVALVLGWSGWNFGLPYWGRQSTIDKEAKNEERLKEKFKIDVRKMKSLGFTKRVPFTGPKSGKPKGKLGVDYVAIERYDGLIQYYKKP